MMFLQALMSMASLEFGAIYIGFIDVRLRTYPTGGFALTVLYVGSHHHVDCVTIPEGKFISAVTSTDGEPHVIAGMMIEQRQLNGQKCD
jgi:hypothetical protein